MKVTLRKITPTDIRYFSKWWRDPVLARLTSGSRARKEDIPKYFNSLTALKKDIHRMIVAGRRIVGHVALEYRTKRSMEITIVIGEKPFWGKGIGTEAIVKMVSLARRRGVESVILEVRKTNIRAIASYEKAGFKKSGKGRLSRLMRMRLSLR
jgi:RimJ/RimL family protein N-acetyltransferase